MPVVVQGSVETRVDDTIIRKDFDYDYPYGLDLRPTSETHQKLRNEIIRRATLSHNLITRRVPSWNKIDETMTGYVDLTDDEESVLEDNKYKPVSIVFPYTYVIIETILTYLTQVFLQETIFHYSGEDSSDIPGGILLTKVIKKQCDNFKVALSLYTFLRDSLVYGIAAGSPIWSSITGTQIRAKSTFGTFFGKGKTREVSEEVIFEGNRFENIDPYLFLPDPSTPIHKVQESEFVGWVDRTHRLALLREEKLSDGNIFNCKYLKALQRKQSSIFAADQTSRNKKTGISDYSSFDTMVQNPVDVIYMYVDLVPSEWKIGDSDYPEKWLFGLAGDDIIIRAQKLGLAHNMYPVVTTAPEFDGHSVIPLARTEILNGMQTVLDWLFNSHIANVRKAINDTIIVDPYLVNVSDLRDPKAGKIVRLRRPAWGRGVKDAVQQLAITDITRSNIADSSVIINWMQKIGAADESMMGALRQGGPERLTGAEFSGTRAGSVSRLEKIAQVISLQAMKDLAYMMASHTQQLMSQETFINITGDYQKELVDIYGNGASRLKVSPYDLMIAYDVVANDGTVPGNGDVKTWVRLYDTMIKNPNVAQNFDMVRIFEYIAQELGAKSVSRFRIQPKIMPDEEVMKMQQAGNVVPVGTGGVL